MGRVGHVVKRRAFGQEDQGSKPPAAVLKLGNFVQPTFPVSFGRDIKSRWSLLSGVCAREVKDPTSAPHRAGDLNL